MPKLADCLKKSLLGAPEKRYIETQADALIAQGVPENEAHLQAVEKMKDSTLDVLEDIQRQIETPSTEGEISDTQTIDHGKEQTQGREEILLGNESQQAATSLRAEQPVSDTMGDSAQGFKGLKVGDPVEYEWLGQTYTGTIVRFKNKKAHVKGDGPVANTTYPIKAEDIRHVQVKKAKPKSEQRAVEYNSKLKKPIGIVGDPSSGFMFQSDMGETIAKFFQKQFTTKGYLPRPVFDRWLEAKAQISKYESQIRFTVQDFKKVIKEDYGKKISDEQITDINLALQGKQPVNPIPAETLKMVAELRAQIDNLTNRFINEGVVSGEMSATFTKNLGTYLTRSYRKYDDPFWADFVPEQVKNKAMALLKSKYPNHNQQEMDGLVNFLLHSPEAPMAVLKGGKLGSKDLSILKKRGDIAPEIRALMGEYGDPLLNYARSVTKMANMIAKHHFLEDVRTAGKGSFLFDKPTGKHHVKIAAEGSRTMAPLNGLYTTEEIAEAFNEFNSTEPMGDIARYYMKFNGYLKLGKTVFSIMTHARNFFGNLGFVVMNGHWRLNKFGKATQTAWANVYSTDKGIRDKFQEYIELGIVQDSAAAGQLRQYIDDIKEGHDIFQRLNETRMDKAKNFLIKNPALELTQNLYQFEDDLYKIFAFENEMARYGKAYPQMPLDQLQKKAADVVRNTYPTYSMIPKIVKTIRVNPLVGTFVSFPAEVLRTTWNTAALIKEELSNPSTRDIGMQRLVGFMLAMGIPTTASYFSMFALGIDGEDDEALRKFVAPWQKTSEFLYLNVDGTKYKLVDMGYSDPHSYLKRPWYALMKDEDLTRGAINAAVEIFEPFLSEEMLAERLLDIERNQKKSGDHVYNPDAPLGDRVADITSHLAAVAEPGTVRSLENIYKGFYGKTDKYGKKFEASNEIAALLTGQKQEVKDIDQGFLFRVYEIKDRLEVTDTDYQRVAKSKAATQEEKDAAEKERKAAINRIVADAVSIYHAALRLGVDPKQAKKLMRNARSKEINKKIREGN